MSKDESALSSASGLGLSGGTQAQLVKVLANVVETQKTVASQFSALFDRIEEARNETRSNVNALTDEIRKLEIRSVTMFEKVTTQLIGQNDALSSFHSSERAQLITQNDNVLDLLKTAINSTPHQAPAHLQPINAYNQANPMFSDALSQLQSLANLFGQPTPDQIARLMMQQLQLQQQLQQQAAFRTAASATTNTAPAPITPVPTTPAVVTPATVPKVEVKPVEVKPVVPSPAPTVAPAFSFGLVSKPISIAVAPAPPAATGSPFSFVAPKINAEVKKETADDESDDDDEEEYEPDVHFAPVIPLPDMVETVTGEESETVLFDERCKLFRFTKGEWKERALGTLKVLKNEKTGKHRVVVRRDQVHKVAANFNLVPGVRIAPIKSSPKAVVWFCHDFSENEEKGENEQLSARFASALLAEEFMDLVNTIIEDMPASSATPKKAENSKTEEEKPKKSAAVAPAPGAATPAWGDKFKMAAGEWECAECYVRNAADAAECSCCGSVNPNCEQKPADKPANPFGKNATIFNPTATSGSTSKFSFGLACGSTASPSTVPAAVPKTETKPAASPATFSFNASIAPATPKFSFMQAAAAATKEDEKKPIVGSAPSAASNVFGAGLTPAATGVSNFSFKSAAATASPLPSFKTPDPSKPASSIFGGSTKTIFGNPATPVDAKQFEEEKKETPNTVFGSSFMTGSQSNSAGFGGLASTGKPSIFEQQDKVAEGQKNFAALAKSKPFGQSAAVAAAAAAPANDEDGEEGDPEEYEPDVQFAPVIPLPALVEVRTGEENETVLFTARSKIFRFIRETKEYKERGVGDLKLLHDVANNRFRVVMRRDQVHKLCANFSVLKTSNLTTKEGQDNVRSIVVNDFAENEQGDMEMLCIKFKNADVAREFENAFEDARARLQ